MENQTLRQINGTKIRRQYFTVPLVILYTVMLAIPYAVSVIAWCLGKVENYAPLSTLGTSVWICFVLSIPFLILHALNKHCFGRIVCVLNEEGIYYTDKKHIRWETVERLEYRIDSGRCYPGDTGKAFRVIVYTKGGRHVVLDKAPLCIVSRIKKYRGELPVRILGATSLLSTAAVIAAILLASPLYVALLANAPGASTAQLAVLILIWLVLGIVRIPVFDACSLPYRFWRKILPKKWLSYLLLGIYYPSFFAALLILSYFPNWTVAILLGIYLGTVQPPFPSRYGSGRFRAIPSYEKLYETYITGADFWEARIAKRNADRTKDQ